ncbi:VPLPA-CTERM sorting domain-containing protein [Thiocapsa bogorovii]|uniref:VPLPA-CTERM sorting domain-containing protein n=1 Tax=Thiocapsa bogorovii TaxID=521689 RepID=UPI001E3BA9F4|nr:VPLPA-CTERM sorting domain-containing protein [Thiocapsa bogorovii]UHD16221.1 VPLPA-CTERM sorting domain-containing protein [Thiocapsa bogorovii]
MRIATRNLVGLVAISAFALHSVPATAERVDATQASFQYGFGQAGITKADDRHLNANALDGSTSTFRSLGLNGSAVFGFGTAFSGPVTVWETTFNTCNDTGAGTCRHWPEKVAVYAGNSWDFSKPSFPAMTAEPSQWTKLGELGNFAASPPNGGTLNADGVFRYLLLVDLGLNTSSPKDGFDVAKVSVNAVPIPAAGWLFGSALIGLAAVSRRKKVRSEKHRES